MRRPTWVPVGGDWLQRRWVDIWRVIEVGSKACADQFDMTRIPGFLSQIPVYFAERTENTRIGVAIQTVGDVGSHSPGVWAPKEVNLQLCFILINIHHIFPTWINVHYILFERGELFSGSGHLQIWEMGHHQSQICPAFLVLLSQRWATSALHSPGCMNSADKCVCVVGAMADSVIVATSGGSAFPRPTLHRMELHTVMTRSVVSGCSGVNLLTQMLILNSPSLHSGQTFSNNKTRDLTHASVLLMILRNKDVTSM